MDEPGSAQPPWGPESALMLTKVGPGACVLNSIRVGPAGATLLETVSLGGLRLRQQSSFASVFEALRVNTRLRKLSLRKLTLEVSELALLFDVLKANSTLEELSLEHIALDEASGQALGAALEANTTLRVLDLEGASGAALFCRAQSRHQHWPA